MRYWPTRSVVTAVLAVLALESGAAARTLQLVKVVDVNGPVLNYLGGLGHRADLDVLEIADVQLDAETGDALRLRVHRVTPWTGAVTATFPLSCASQPYAPVSGIALAGGSLFITVFSSGVNGIAEYTHAGGLVNTYDFQGTEGNIRTKGLAYDGRYLWQAHFSPNVGHLYAIDPATNTRASDIKVDPYPVGLDWDGRFFWVSHFNPANDTSYIAKYDRSGFKLDQFSLPNSLTGAAIGDLAVDGRHIYGQLPGFDGIAHMVVPRAPAPPALPAGVVRQSTLGQAMIRYGPQSYTDVQSADLYDRLPVMASLRRTFGSAAAVDKTAAPRGSAETLATAGTYFAPGDRSVRNISHAMTYADGRNAPLDAEGTLTINRTMVIPEVKNLGPGDDVNAKGRLALHGLLQLVLDRPAPSAEDLWATLRLQVIRKGAAGDLTCFDGIISLEGKPAGGSGPWAEVSFGGDLAGTNAAQTLQDNLFISPRLAALDLDNVSLVFRVPAKIRRPFSVDFVIRAATHVPTQAPGWGSETAFGDPAVLDRSYSPLLDAASYNDGYLGDLIDGDQLAAVPEPGCLALLALAGAWFLPQRRRER